MSHSALMATLILAPLFGFFINGFRYKKHSANTAGILATCMAAVSFICSLLLVVDLVSMPAEGRQIAVQFFQWMSIANLKVNMGFVVDPISAIMILVVTGVGSLIHLFSIGYMHHDSGAAKYFAYLNL
ncbi:MAG: NADH-quinone oxidoreductase subunit L, partial [Pseudobdellovibrionaceae bacterium]